MQCGELEERELSLPDFVRGNSTNSFETALWHLSFPTTEISPSLYLPRGDTKSFLKASKILSCLEKTQQDLTTTSLSALFRSQHDSFPPIPNAHEKQSNTGAFLLQPLPGSSNDLLQLGESFTSLMRRNLGQAAVVFSLHRSRVNSQPATRALSFHIGSDFLTLTTIPLGISGDQHIFRLDSAGSYHNKSFRAAFPAKNPLVVMFLNELPFILKSHLEQKQLFHSSVFKAQNQLQPRTGLFDLIWRAVNTHVLSTGVTVMLYSKLPHHRAMDWSLGLMICVYDTFTDDNQINLCVF